MCQTCADFINHMHGSDETKAEKLRAETELELARIRRDEAIQLAKIGQKMNEDDNDAALVVAEAAAEIQADVIEDLTAPDENNIIIQDAEPAVDEEMPEEEIAEAPPEVEPETVPRSKSAWSYW